MRYMLILNIIIRLTVGLVEEEEEEEGDRYLSAIVIPYFLH